MRSLKSVFSNDEVFAHPTEGVWGLGCNPFSSKAVENLFELKKRPKNKAEIKKIFGQDLYIADGKLGKLNKPTSVQELITGKWIRK